MVLVTPYKIMVFNPFNIMVFEKYLYLYIAINNRHIGLVMPQWAVLEIWSSVFYEQFFAYNHYHHC